MWNDNTPPLSCGWQITVKNWQNLPISNPKPDLHNIDAHTKFDENPFIFTYYSPETKIWKGGGQITIPSLVKVHGYLLVIVLKWKYGLMYNRQIGTWISGEIIIPHHYSVAGIMVRYKKAFFYKKKKKKTKKIAFFNPKDFSVFLYKQKGHSNQKVV